MSFAHGQQFSFDGSVEDGIFRLNDIEASILDILLDLSGRDIGGSDSFDFPGGFQLVQHFHSLGYWRVIRLD